MRTKILASGALAALALAGCQQQQAAAPASSQPLAAPTQAETAPAPAATALPPAPPAPVRHAPPARRYAYLDDAYAMSSAYADAPPDYAFDYDGGAPQAWDSPQGVVRVGEPVRGGWRYYYYRPGADMPYLVRDPDYAYGYEDGQLVVVYDSRGRALDPSYADRQAAVAGRYLARSRALWRAARENQRREVEARVWREQQAEQARQRREWEQNQQADADWRDYHRQYHDQERANWVQVAAMAAAMALHPQPGPDGGPRPMGGGVRPQGDRGQGDRGDRGQGDHVQGERDAWRARMAQQAPQPANQPGGPGPRQPGGWSRGGPQGGPHGGLQGAPQGAPQGGPQGAPQGAPQGGFQGGGQPGPRGQWDQNRQGQDRFGRHEGHEGPPPAAQAQQAPQPAPFQHPERPGGQAAFQPNRPPQPQPAPAQHAQPQPPADFRARQLQQQQQHPVQPPPPAPQHAPAQPPAPTPQQQQIQQGNQHMLDVQKRFQHPPQQGQPPAPQQGQQPGQPPKPRHGPPPKPGEQP